jgi:hypothetical protein
VTFSRSGVADRMRSRRAISRNAPSPQDSPTRTFCFARTLTPMRTWLDHQSARLNGLLRRHPVRALVVSSSLMVLLWGVVFPNSEHHHLSWFTWLAIVMMLYAAVGFLRLPRIFRRAGYDVLYVLWTVALLPFMWGWLAVVVEGSTVWLLVAGTALTTALLVVWFRSARTRALGETEAAK